MKRLPTKSLMRFMSVSKQWKSIIQSSPFIADHYNTRRRHILPPHHYCVLCYDDGLHVDIFSDDNRFLQRLAPPMPAAKYLCDANIFIGCSQGLFVFHYFRDNVTVIWNSSIRKSVYKPVPEHNVGADDFGFTVVCNTSEPTILRITYKPGLKVHIHTLTSRVWRTFSNTLHRESIKIFRCTMVVIDRFIHWMASDCTPKGDILNKMIVSCDITSERFTELCLPPSLAAVHTHDLCFSKLRESLVVLENDLCKQEIGVWIVMEPGVQNSFVKLYTVKIPSRELPEILGFRKNGRPIIQMFVYPSKWSLYFDESDSDRFNIRIFLSEPPKVHGFRKDGQPIIQFNESSGKQTLLSYEPDLERLNEFNSISFGNKDHFCLEDSYTETLLLIDHPDCISC